MLPSMLNVPNAVGQGIEPGLAIIAYGISCPAIPQLRHYLDEFVGAIVALIDSGLPLLSEIRCRCRRPRGYDIPTDAAAAQMVERRELPREIVGLAVGRRSGGDQPDPVGQSGEGAEQHQRLELTTRGMSEVFSKCDMVGEENRVQFRRFCRQCEIAVMG